MRTLARSARGKPHSAGDKRTALRSLFAAATFSLRAVVLAGTLLLTAYLVARPFLMSPAWHSATEPGWSFVSAWPRLIGRTVVVAATAALACLLPALPLGYVLFRTDAPLRRALTSVLLLAACMPLFVTASAVLSLVGFRLWQGQSFAAGLVHGWAALPAGVLIAGLGYRGVAARISDAARLDASPVRAWWRVEVPLARWGWLAAALLAMWVSSTDITVTDLIAVPTLAEEAYVSFQLGDDTRWQSLLIVPYLAGFGALLWSVSRAARTAEIDAARLALAAPRVTHLRGGRRAGAAVITLGAVGTLLFPPFVRLGGSVGGFAAFTRFSADLIDEFVHSMLLATACAVAVVAIAMALGPALARPDDGVRGRRWVRRGLVLAALVTAAVPTPLLAIALIESLNRPGVLGAVHDSALFPLIGQVLRWWPIGLLAAMPGFLRVTPAMTDAARVDGCRAGDLSRFLYWPVATKYLLLSVVLTIVLTLGEVTANVLLSPPGFLPLSVRFFTLAHYGLAGQAASICLLTMIVLLIPWSLLTAVLQRDD